MVNKINKTVLLKHLFISIIAFLTLYPVLWMLGSSFKPNNMIFSEIWFWPKKWDLQNYVTGIVGVQGSSFYHFLYNSTIVAFCAVIGNVISCSMAAYAFARLNFRFKSIGFALVLMTIMLPLHVTLIPQYILFHKINWIDTFLPLISPKWVAVDGFFIFLIIQFFRGIPKELDEAATIDGCGAIQIYWRILIPLASPALITTAIFTFLWTWDDFFSQLIYLNNVSMYTVPLGLRLFIDSSFQSNWGAMFAMSVLSLVPCFIVFIAAQKYFVEGIATSGIKG